MVKIYSHSRINCFEQCPLKFKYKYIDKIVPEIEKSIEAHLGSCVHDSLEWIYKEIQQNRIPKLEDVINYYAKKWEDNYTEDIRIVKDNLTAKDYFNKGVEFIANYYTKHYPFKDGTLECEKKVVLDLDSEKSYKIQGFIDRFVYNYQTGEYEIHDYKTANNLPDKEKVEKDRQLALYSLAIKEKLGKDKDVSLVWHYLAHNTKISIKKSNQELEKLRQEVLNLIKEIENTEYFIPKKSVLCDWCEYKSMCPVFGGKVNERQQKIEKYPEKDYFEKVNSDNSKEIKEENKHNKED